MANALDAKFNPPDTVCESKQYNFPKAEDVQESRMKFKVYLETDEDGWITATVPSLPGCISQGKTEKEAIANIREAIGLHVSSLSREGKPVPVQGKAKMVEVVFPS